MKKSAVIHTYAGYANKNQRQSKISFKWLIWRNTKSIRHMD